MDKNRSIDVSKAAYQHPQPTGMIFDTFVAAALDLDANEREWIPQSADVSFRPLILNVSQGYYINILRVRASGVLSRHRHSGPVHGILGTPPDQQPISLPGTAVWAVREDGKLCHNWVERSSFELFQQLHQSGPTRQ